MNTKDFVRRSVKMQLGGVKRPLAQNNAAMVHALQQASSMAVACLPNQDDLFTLSKDGSISRLPKDASNLNAKTSRAVNEIRAQNPTFGFVVDMQDWRLPVQATHSDAPYPVFSFNRHKDDQNRVLWPLPTYHDFDSEQFLVGIFPQTVPWQEKHPRMIWRGITTGRSLGRRGVQGEGVRLKSALRRYSQGKLAEKRLQRIVSTTPRYQAVSLVQSNPRYDFGFVDGDGHVISQTPMHSHLERPRVPREHMQGFRYIAVLRGMDVGSSFYWVMNSGSVGFVQETPFDTFASRHFAPWQHYIPFREDAQDLDAQFDWAEAHQKECEGMTLRSAEICRYLQRIDLRHDILKTVIAELNGMERV